MDSIACCESCDKPIHEGDDHAFDPEGIVWVCRSCVDAEEDRLREEFGWIGVWRGGTGGEGVTNITDTGGPGP